jgi:polysaccharide export outer membrane protein
MTTFGRTILTLLLVWPALAFEETPPPVNALTLEDVSRYTLGPDDQLKIWAYGVDEINEKPVRIDPSGYIDLPVIGRLKAAGLTVEQFRAALLKELGREVREPRVSMDIVEFGSQPVSVIGAVNQPGVHQLRGRKTLVELLSLAGGLRPDAGARIKISRVMESGRIPLRTAKVDSSEKFSVAEVKVKELMSATDPAENILIQPRDVVTVPVADVIYVIGAVRKPGPFVLNERETMSVLQALSMAEGLGPTPAPQNSKILRTISGSTERKELAVDLKKVMAGKAEDIALRANDILLVPDSSSKKAMGRAVEAAIQAATGIVIWRRP